MRLTKKKKKNSIDLCDFRIAGSVVPRQSALASESAPPPRRFIVAPGTTSAAVSTCLSPSIAVGDAAPGGKWIPGHGRVNKKPAPSPGFCLLRPSEVRQNLTDQRCRGAGGRRINGGSTAAPDAPVTRGGQRGVLDRINNG